MNVKHHEPAVGGPGLSHTDQPYLRGFPLVTVNILAYNRINEVRTTLQKITGELDYPADRLEIIVVDNASGDGTSEMVAAEFPAVRVIRNGTNTGIAGWNRGFEVGTGDYFLVLDDDCYITGDSLQRAVQAAQAQEADLVSFEVTTPFVEGFYYNRVYDMGLLGFWGCSALISRRAIDALGGFDPNIFVWAHEVEFTMRLLDRGFKHLYLPDVTAFHLKTPPVGDVLNVNLQRHNQRHLAYGAAKLLRLPHALFAFGNMMMRPPIWAYHFRSWRALVFIPELLKGFAQGWRNRQPLGAKTSAVYKRNFIEFANPLPFVRNRKRAERYFVDRPRYYPKRTATLQLSGDPAAATGG